VSSLFRSQVFWLGGVGVLDSWIWIPFIANALEMVVRLLFRCAYNRRIILFACCHLKCQAKEKIRTTNISSVSSYYNNSKQSSNNRSRGPRPSDPLRPSLSSAYDVDIDETDDEQQNVRASTNRDSNAYIAPAAANTSGNPMHCDTVLDELEFSDMSAKTPDSEKRDLSSLP
jgi:hypothetical protein